MEKIEFTAVIFKEDSTYVALSPELNVSSFGDTVEEAKRALAEAVEAFLEECRNLGSLSEILEEAGSRPIPNWRRASGARVRRDATAIRISLLIGTHGIVYSIRVHRDALKVYRRLEKSLQMKIDDAVEKLAADPFRRDLDIKRLHGEFAGYCRREPPPSAAPSPASP